MRFVILFVVSGLLLGAKGQKGECPDGSRAVGDPPPKGYALICYNHRRWKHGLATYWHDNGKKKEEGEYKDGKKHGKWTYWHDNGQKSEQHEYKDGKKHGKWTEKYLEGEYKDGKRHGKWTVRYSNSQKYSEGEYKDGKKQGKWTVWYINGRKYSEGEYKDGKRHGKWTVWYSLLDAHGNGRKYSEGEYKDDKLIGKLTIWRLRRSGQRLRWSANDKDGDFVPTDKPYEPYPDTDGDASPGDWLD